MAISKTVKHELRDLAFFALISLVQARFMCPRCNTPVNYIYVATFTFFMWILLWKGNALLAGYLSKKIPWKDRPQTRLLVGIITTIAYTVISVVGLFEIYKLIGFSFGNSARPTVYISVAVTIVISLFLHGREFFLFWKQASLEAERFQNESIKAKYESLKNQVNPHFLFNSLNALTSLVHDQPDKAVKFIKQLSEVYRYVLDTRDKEVVSLREELKFLKSYLFLQQIRFGSKLRISLKITDDQVYLPPLALQMLIENAIKHNVISEEDPLTIGVAQDNGYVVVENNLQRKTSISEPSAGVGLENIRKRFEFLTSQPVVVDESLEKFVVRLPQIKEPI